ncbi:hypothetical protein [Streptomyces sp. NPDC058394]|uniref:hypothetical protein n=1 Tax=Streptomyces sp. NPDC058394 TaxID=3346477 RepID=UPI00365B5A2A
MLPSTSMAVIRTTPAGATSPVVYLPSGAAWTCAWTGERYEGGAHYVLPAPIDRIPLLLRDGARLPVME